MLRSVLGLGMISGSVLWAAPVGARPSASVSIEVKDADGQVIPYAEVTAVEDKRGACSHDSDFVDPRSGRWHRAEIHYHDDHWAARRLERGDEIQFYVRAPGHVTMGRWISVGRGETHTVMALSPLVVPDLDCLPEGLDVGEDAGGVLSWAEERLGDSEAVGGMTEQEQACVMVARAVAAHVVWREEAEDFASAGARLEAMPSLYRERREMEAAYTRAREVFRDWGRAANKMGLDDEVMESWFVTTFLPLPRCEPAELAR